MAETKINFIKGRPENVNNGQERNQYKEDRIRQKKEKSSLERVVSKIMENEGIGLEEALKRANEKINKPRFSKFDGNSKSTGKPQRPRFEKKEGFKTDKPKRFEKKDDQGSLESKPQRFEGSKFQSEKPVSERYKGSKPRRSNVPFGERRNKSRDNALISDFQRKLEILKNANKLDD